MHGSFPTPFQKKTLWSAITAFSLVVTGAILVGLVWLVTWLIAFLQPLLIPLAVAGVLTYLLYPLVDRLIDRGIPQKRASTLVFAGFMAMALGLVVAVAKPASEQASELIGRFPEWTRSFERIIDDNLSAEGLGRLKARYRDHGLLGHLVRWLPDESDEAERSPDDAGAAPADDEGPADRSDEASTPEPPSGDAGGDREAAGSPADPTAPPVPATGTEPGEDASRPGGPPHVAISSIRTWALGLLPKLGSNLVELVRASVGGFLGAFGFVLGFFLVPLYLFFFLREAPTISDRWSDYIPLRASRFKDELVGTLNEVNTYLVAFFRGQMLVSLIDGLITAVLLTVIGLKAGILIGLFVGILGVIPYLGIIICYLPAVIIATVQGANGNWYIAPDAPWWVLPLVVTVVFIAVNNLDGILIAPKIVGDSVGLHPFTVIFSVIFWSTLLGGLLGALLAVPLTASIKVLFRRYIWVRRIRPELGAPSLPPLADEPEKPETEPT